MEYTHPYGKTAAGPLRRQYALIDVTTGRRTPILTDLADGEFVSVVGWRGEEVLVHHFDARATVQVLTAVSRVDGTRRTLVTEPITLSGAMFLRRTQARRAAIADDLLADPGQLLWPSDRTGWNHWYVVDLARAGTERQLTHGDFDVEEIVHVDEAAGLVWFIAHADPARPYDAQLCRVRLDGTGQCVLTPESGDHEVSVRPGGAVFLDCWSTVAQPPRCVVRDGEGRLLFELPAPPAADPCPQVRRREVTVKAADRVTDLHAVVYLPPEYDDAGSFPLVDVIYGGPQLPVRPTRFDQSASSRSFDGHPVLRGSQAHALAALGFVTLVLDNTGTPGRGVAFQEAVRRRMGQIEIPDHVAAIRQLAGVLPGVDLDRVGITGRSWGGYLVIRAMLTAPEFFKVGVADAPAADHYDHIGHLAFEIMGFPNENAEGYELGSCLRVADQLAGRLLIAHGTNDLSATLSGSMKLVDAFVKQGRLVDQFFFPEGTHHPRGQRLFYLDALIARYLVAHLGPAGVQPQDVPFVGD